MGLPLYRLSTYTSMQLFLFLFFVVMIKLLKVDEKKKDGNLKKKISLASFRAPNNTLKEDDKEMARLIEE